MNMLTTDSVGTAIVRDADNRFWFRLPGPEHRWHRLSPPPAASAVAAPVSPPPSGGQRPRRRLSWRRAAAFARLIRSRIVRAIGFARRPQPQ
ncbi:MAG: hypothetical protein ACKVS9_05740 [Phycisphaerae bacterium]